jgi:hypothetical protein
MGRHLIDRKTCDACGHVVETRADGQEEGHGPHEPVPEVAPASEETGDAVRQ